MSESTIAIIDYGMGNLHSVASALNFVAPQVQVQVTSSPETVLKADRVIFPGVGAIRDCIGEIRRLQFDRVVSECISSGKPLLGICVGMQALMNSSEENGGVTCLSHFPGEVKSFADNDDFNAKTDEGAPSGERLKVPHMGWNQVRQNLAHPLWQDIPDQSRFYFVHSFCVQSAEPSLIAGSCHYGIDFTAAVAKDNVFATQFHPEKSHDHGLQLLKNFVVWDGLFKRV